MNNEALPAREVRAVLARHHVVESALLASIRALPPAEAASLARELRQCANDRAPYTRAPILPSLTPAACESDGNWRQGMGAQIAARRGLHGRLTASRWRRHLAQSAWGIASLLCTFYVAWYASFS
jgi:hypothetical protein